MQISPFYLFLFLLFPSLSYTQQLESLHCIKIGIPEATYSYEHALGKQFSMNMEAGVNLGWLNSNHNTTLLFRPILLIEPRFYYNVIRRHKEDRFINNSASFFSISSGLIFDSFNLAESSAKVFIIPKWGFRRAMGNHFIFETQIGGGIEFGHGSSQFIPGLDIKFGYIF